MLLLETLDDQKYYKLCYDTLAWAAIGDGHSSDKTLNVVVTSLLRRFPQLGYNGPMYRVVYIPVKEFLSFESNIAVLNYIRRFKSTETHHSPSRIYQSWAKTANGLNNFMAMSRTFGGDDYEPHWNETIQVGTILAQQSRGLLVGVALKYLAKQLKNGNGDSLAGQVGEVLAPIEQNMSIKLYHVHGLGNLVYEPDDFSQEDIDDMNATGPDPYDGDPREHRYEKDWQVLPSQFNVLQARLKHEFERKEPSRNTRTIKHPKSQMRKIKTNHLST